MRTFDIGTFNMRTFDMEIFNRGTEGIAREPEKLEPRFSDKFSAQQMSARG
jgi:hypothetical protein